MVGDDISSDIEGSINASLKAIQVKTGKFQKKIWIMLFNLIIELSQLLTCQITRNVVNLLLTNKSDKTAQL